MTPLHHRQEVLNALQGEWAEYVDRYRSLPAPAQSTFLRRQGYARFADLLAHIMAWWNVCRWAIERYQADPAARPDHYDEDDFNARAVASASRLTDEQVIKAFEEMRRAMIEFVTGLPDAAFENETVVTQLEMDFVGHLEEHEIAKGDRGARA